MHLTTYQRPDFKPLLNICRGLGGTWSGGRPADWPKSLDSPKLAVPSPESSTDTPLTGEDVEVELSELLQLPSDAILLVYDQLDPPEALSLSITCKSLYRLCFFQHRGTLSPDDRRRFLLLLERDPGLGRGVFYCYPCNRLHPFQQHWAPGSSPNGAVQDCDNRDRFAPIGNRFNLSYTLARLVMNGHFYGPSHGIPLRNICISHTEQRDVFDVLCTTDARIQNDELYLLRTYNFTITRHSVDEFRKCTGARDFRLCQHMPLLSGSSAYRQHIPQLQRRPRSNESGLVPCEEAEGSCSICLMDYDITISTSIDGGEGWDVSIRAYHQLGACRSPDDWKWARFTEASRPHLFFPNRPNRRGSALGARTVKEQWSGSKQEEAFDGKKAPTNLKDVPIATRPSSGNGALSSSIIIAQAAHWTHPAAC
ncbi:F-box domain-containing protein [Purpureocillium lavendulum]|uniref:F-box domain-containing protein n=1 Tax=Purpureocillium lavendulum TaxID=1247861 RepID=A0AB34FZ32_9HYPO|nr:F-box domain-containing protein [Purpureocillium lavendulum]